VKRKRQAEKARKREARELKEQQRAEEEQQRRAMRDAIERDMRRRAKVQLAAAVMAAVVGLGLQIYGGIFGA
jgi:ferric-dicitrate binding protein FerR (iron transport regulator)